MVLQSSHRYKVIPYCQIVFFAPVRQSILKAVICYSDTNQRWACSSANSTTLKPLLTSLLSWSLQSQFDNDWLQTIALILETIWNTAQKLFLSAISSVFYSFSSNLAKKTYRSGKNLNTMWIMWEVCCNPDQSIVIPHKVS